jgi:GrpB-like predicted nucleotidyltransferase (UPF0157 family)
MYVYPKLEEARQKARDLGLPMVHSSQRKNKKLFVVYNGKKIHFGDRRFSDFLTNQDEEQRARYRARASKIKDKNGVYSYDNPNTANFWAYNIIW